jgi:hypothetical protein
VIATWLYYRARAGMSSFRILYGITCAYIVMSGFSEALFNQINFSFKAAVFVFLIYGWRLPQRARLAHYGVSSKRC